MKRAFCVSLMVFGLLVFMLSTAYGAELNLNKFNVNPSPFKKGQTLSLSLEIANPNATPANNIAEVYVYVKDGTPEREGPGSFLGKAPVPNIGANGKVTLNLPFSYTVPAGAVDQIKFTIFLPSITPGVEFGPAFEYKFNASCSYAPPLKLVPLGKIPRLQIK